MYTTILITDIHARNLTVLDVVYVLEQTPRITQTPRIALTAVRVVHNVNHQVIVKYLIKMT